MRTRTRPLLAALLLSLSWPGAALADGVSDERVSLPDGPGSIGGVGHNVELDPNMGLSTQHIPIDLPEGHPNATPSLALTYSSGGGAGLLGLGWDMAVGRIERMTQRGLPRYTTADEFTADGGTQLVEVAQDAGVRAFRARREGGFVRYEWHGAGEGAGGYWVAKLPDGLVAYYGADADGEEVAAARLSGPSDEVFAYQLVELSDAFGNRIRYQYEKAGRIPLLSRIEYGFNQRGEPRYSVHIAYESRPDPVSDAKPGFEITWAERPVEIAVKSLAETIHSYTIAYEDDADAVGLSRVATVRRFGREGGEHPIAFRFGYSGALGGTCVGRCEQPFVADMGTLPGGVDLATGRATLIDINGDAVPDVLSTNDKGEHSFVLATPSASGRPTFETEAVESAETRGGSAFVLTAPGVQVLDVNGDGYSDIVASRAPAVLCNDGSGDWASGDCMADATLPVMDSDEVGDENPKHVRFFDYDNDRRIDMLRTTESGTEVFVNDGASFRAISVEDIGALFDESRLELADMNGDGLQDPVEILDASTLRYRLNLGYGRWTEWRSVSLPDFGASALLEAELQDINGDGRDDLVVVAGVEVRYALNMSGGRFGSTAVLDSAAVDGELPERTATTSVFFADMNGNGTDDVVWVTSSGRVKFLELAPVRPNLLTRVDNSIGHVQQIEYASSVSELARDAAEAPWSHRLPHAMVVVSAIDSWVSLTGGEGGQGLHAREELSYRDGFYSSVEKNFHGYAAVTRTLVGDMNLDSQDPLRSELTFDVGEGEAGYYRAGQPLTTRHFGGAELTTPLREVRIEYGDCPLYDVPDSGLLWPVRYVCETAETVILQEGRPEAEWATLRSELSTNGYGQTALRTDLGVVHMGSPEQREACAPCDGGLVPCGKRCGGDEHYVESRFIAPGEATDGAWILDRASQVFEYGDPEGERTETQYFYDGDDFEGLPLGRLTRGSLSRARLRSADDDDSWIDIERSAADAFGNAVVTLDPLGDPDDATGHRRTYTYDDYGLNVVRSEVAVGGDDRHSLRREYTYDQGLNLVSEATGWMVVSGGDSRSARNSIRYRYDEFGRVTAVLRPGADEPDAEYHYELGEPVSRIIERRRSQRDGDLDLAIVHCQDGLGRTYQSRVRIDDDRYLVSGFVVMNRNGAVVRSYQSYESGSDACETTAPDGVAHVDSRFDALNRLVAQSMPDAEAFDGTASTTRFEYGPLAMVNYDEEDTRADGAFADTPTVKTMDGLGRLVRHTRMLEGGDVADVTLEYDDLGRLVAVYDPAGNAHQQTFDLAGRVVRVDDPNSGTTRFEYDLASNLLARTDAAGNATRFAYDGLNRQVAVWDAADAEATRQTTGYDVIDDCKRCSNTAGLASWLRFPTGGEGADQGLVRFGYDPRGNTVYRGVRVEGHDLDVSLTYDNDDRLVSRELPDGQVIACSYDGADRTVAIDGVVDGVEYDGRGNMARIDRANGLTTELVFDRMQDLSERRVMRGDETVFGVALTRDRVGNVLSVEDTGPERGLAHAVRYSYDAWYRVVGSEYATTAGDPLALTRRYDLLDNPTAIRARRGEDAEPELELGKLRYEGAGPNQLTEAGRLTLAYDEAGRMTDRGGLNVEWDSQGRVIGYGNADGESVRFVYGAGTDRMIKHEGGGVTYYLPLDDFEVRDGVSVAYVRLGGSRVAALKSDALQTELLSDVAPVAEPDDRITAADAWVSHAAAEGIGDIKVDGADASEQLLRASARRTLLTTGKARVHLHPDHLGSLVLATDADGAVIAERAFTDTGLERASTGYVDAYGFTGQEHEADGTLVRMGARVLDARTGRWLSSDPLFERSTPGLAGMLGESTVGYAYVANNPANHIDPTGTVKWLKAAGRNIAAGSRHVANWAAGFGSRKNHMGFFDRLKSPRETTRRGAVLRAQAKWFRARGMNPPGRNGGSPTPRRGRQAAELRARHAAQVQQQSGAPQPASGQVASQQSAIRVDSSRQRPRFNWFRKQPQQGPGPASPSLAADVQHVTPPVAAPGGPEAAGVQPQAVSGASATPGGPNSREIGERTFEYQTKALLQISYYLENIE